MHRHILRSLAFTVLFCLSCVALPAAAHAQERPYTAPVVLQVTPPGAAEPITVTVQIAVTVPSSAAPASLPLTVTQAAASTGSVRVVSAQPAQPVEGGRAVALTPGAAAISGVLATPTPQPAAAAEAAQEPAAGVVNDAANLRTGPGTSYAVAGKAQAGDAVQVVGKSADGEWYKLAGGEWIAAFLVDVEGAAGLAVADAPSAADSWPRYEMITGDLSFAYPPEFSVSNEEESIVTLTSGSSAYDPTLQISVLPAGAAASFIDYEETIRILKTAMTRLSGFDHRFVSDGTIDGERGGVYLAGAASQDGIDIDFVTAILPADPNYMIVLYYRYGAADIEAEALPVLSSLGGSIRIPSQEPAAATTAPLLPNELTVKEALREGPSQGGGGVDAGLPVDRLAGTSVPNRYMAGNAVVPLPAPSAADFDVIELARTDDLVYLFVRNNTDAPVHSIGVDTIARGPDGTMLALAETIGMEPDLVMPGQVAYGVLYFSNFTFPDDVVFSHEVSASAAVPDGAYGDLTVAEVNLVGNRFIGSLRNDSQKKISGPIEAVALCFDRNGVYLAKNSEYAVKNQVEAGASIPFEIEVRDACPYYLIFAGGFSF